MKQKGAAAPQYTAEHVGAGDAVGVGASAVTRGASAAWRAVAGATAVAVLMTPLPCGRGASLWRPVVGGGGVFARRGCKRGRDARACRKAGR